MKSFAQEILDALCILYGNAWHMPNKTDSMFDAMEFASNLMGKCRDAGMTLNIGDLRDPTPPKPDLPLFDAFN